MMNEIIQWPKDDVDDGFEAPRLPEEIASMDEKSIDIFKEAISKGTYKSYFIRIMVIGHFGVGKTTLTKRILEEKLDLDRTISTDGIDIHVGRCTYDRKNKEWIINKGIKDTKIPKLEDELLKHGLRSDMEENIKQSMAHQIHETSTPPKKLRSVSKENTPTTRNEPTVSNSETPRNPQRNVDEILQPRMDRTEAERTSLKVQNEEKKNRPDPGRNVRQGSEEEYVQEEGDPTKQIIKKLLKSDTVSDNSLVQIEIWDFGGQAGFYSTHQSFLSYRSLYLLVLDLSKDLESLVDDEDLNPSQKRKVSVKDFMTFWTSSVKTYASGKVPGQPRIMIIGTHLDLIPEAERQEKVKTVLDEISSSFRSDIESGQLILHSSLMLGLDKEDSSDYNTIRKRISEEAEKQPFWGESLPKVWIALQHQLDMYRHLGHKIISLEDISDVNKSLPVPLNKENIDLCLNFQHSLGRIIYFAVPGLRDYAILDPKYLITALRSLITCRQFRSDEFRNDACERLENTGTIQKEIIAKIWSMSQEFRILYDHKDYLLKVMERLDLIASPKRFDENGKLTDVDFYYIPSMVKKSIPHEDLVNITDNNRSIVCCFDFSTHHLPPAIFYRLVGSCLSTWSMVQIHSDCCILQLNPLHQMLIKSKPNIIEVTFIHKKKKDDISLELANNIMDILTSILENILYLYKWINTKTVFTIERKAIEVKGKRKNDEACGSKCPGPSAAEVNRKPKAVELMRFSKSLEDAIDIQIPFATNLGLERAELKLIEHDYCNDLAMKIFNITVKWHKKCTSEEERTFDPLLKAANMTSRDKQHILCRILRSSDNVPGIENKCFDKPCTDELINKIPDFVGKHFVHFGLELGLELVVIERIEYQYQRHLTNIIIEIVKSAGKMCTFGALPIRVVAVALYRMKERFLDFVEFVQQKYKL